MNNGFSNPQVPETKKLSILSIVSMVGSMVFVVAAALMILLPSYNMSMNALARSNLNMMSESEKNITMGSLIMPMNTEQGSSSKNVTEVYGNLSSYDVTVIGKSGSNFMNSYSYLSKNRSQLNSASEAVLDKGLAFVIGATAASFGLIVVVLFVVLGKIRQASGGGRMIALIFSLIGMLISLGYMICGIIYFSQLDDWARNGIIGSQYSSLGISVSVGVGPILMVVFSVITFVFCIIGYNAKQVFRSPYAANPTSPFGGFKPMPQQTYNVGYQTTPQQTYNGGYQPMPQQPFQGEYQPMPQQPFQGEYQPMPQQPFLSEYQPMPQQPFLGEYQPAADQSAFQPDPTPSVQPSSADSDAGQSVNGDNP